jgi:hypothetical protein
MKPPCPTSVNERRAASLVSAAAAALETPF